MKILVNGIDLKLDDRCLSNYVKNHIIGIESDYTYKFKLLKTNKMKNYEITEEQINKLNKNSLNTPYLKEWFTEVFENKLEVGKLEVGKWYKNEDYGNLVFMTDKFKEQCFESKFTTFAKGYGFKFTDKKEWYNDLHFSDSRKFTLATDSEVLEALRNEAKKRGFFKGVYVNRDMFLINKGTVKITSNDGFDFFGVNNCSLQLGGNCIFENGKWATPVKTYTKEEAEKLLKAKII